MITVKKQKYYSGEVFIGKDRTDIGNAAPSEIVRVEFADKDFALEAPRSNICKADAPDYRVKAYPNGAWSMPESVFTKVPL